MNDSKRVCAFCLDATCDPTGELTSENDYSSLSIGRVADNYRMSIDAGDGKPLYVSVTHWNPVYQQNEPIAYYKPKFCPECGRKLIRQRYEGKHADYVHYDFDTIEEATEI